MRAPARRDDGLTLLEVMVSVTILAVLAALAAGTLLAVLRSTSNDRARVAAANLASREVETVRSAFESPAQGPQAVVLGQVVNGAPLPGGTAGAPLVIDKRPYTVTRTSEWETQGATAGPCDGGSSGQLAYLRVSVRVTWGDIGGTTAVTNATLLTPSLGTYNTGTGHIKSKVVDQNSVAESGTTITVATSTGAFVKNEVTASDGCAFFPFLAPGTYTVTAARMGYVDLSGQTSPSQSITVIPNQAVPASFSYAPAATTVFTFDTAQPTYPAPPATALTVYNPTLTSTLHTTSYPNSVPTRTLVTWPYPDGLVAWSGDCTDADPGTSRSSPTTTAAGQTANATVTGARVSVQVSRSAAVLPGVTVEAVHSTSGCPGTVIDPYDNTTSVGEVLRFPLFTDASGIAKATLPFGTWTFKVLGQSAASAWPTVALAGNGSYPVSLTTAVR